MKEHFDNLRNLTTTGSDEDDKVGKLAAIAIAEQVVSDIHRIADALTAIAKRHGHADP